MKKILKIIFISVFCFNNINSYQFDYTGMPIDHDLGEIKFSKDIEISNNKKTNFYYKLRIKFPENLESQYKFCAYYKGKTLDFVNDIATIEEQSEINKFILVLTKEINFKSEGKHIVYLERKNKKACNFYYINGIYDQDDKNIIDWKIEKEDINKLPLRLPDKAIIILINPKFIKGLEFKKEKKRRKKNLKRIIIDLPTIIIKHMNKSEIENDSIRSTCASIDANVVHIKNKKID